MHVKVSHTTGLQLYAPWRFARGMFRFLRGRFATKKIADNGENGRTVKKREDRGDEKTTEKMDRQKI